MPRNNGTGGPNSGVDAGGGGGGGGGSITTGPNTAPSPAALSAGKAYKRNVLEQIRNSLKPFQNASDRLSTGASGYSGHPLQAFQAPHSLHGQSMQPYPAYPLTSSNANYMASANLHSYSHSSGSNLAASQPKSSNSHCDPTATANNVSPDQALNISKQILKQLLESGCSEVGATGTRFQSDLPVCVRRRHCSTSSRRPFSASP